MVKIVLFKLKFSGSTDNTILNVMKNGPFLLKLFHAYGQTDGAILTGALQEVNGTKSIKGLTIGHKMSPVTDIVT
jgi:hypothetical protein